jgi:hypothetical protein
VTRPISANAANPNRKPAAIYAGVSVYIGWFWEEEVYLSTVDGRPFTMRNFPLRISDLLRRPLRDHGVEDCGRQGLPCCFDLVGTGCQYAYVARHGGLRQRLNGTSNSAWSNRNNAQRSINMQEGAMILYSGCSGDAFGLLHQQRGVFASTLVARAYAWVPEEAILGLTRGTGAYTWSMGWGLSACRQGSACKL